MPKRRFTAKKSASKTGPVSRKNPFVSILKREISTTSSSPLAQQASQTKPGCISLAENAKATGDKDLEMDLLDSSIERCFSDIKVRTQASTQAQQSINNEALNSEIQMRIKNMVKDPSHIPFDGVFNLLFRDRVSCDIRFRNMMQEYMNDMIKKEMVKFTKSYILTKAQFYGYIIKVTTLYYIHAYRMGLKSLNSGRLYNRPKGTCYSDVISDYYIVTQSNISELKSLGYHEEEDALQVIEKSQISAILPAQLHPIDQLVPKHPVWDIQEYIENYSCYFTPPNASGIPAYLMAMLGNNTRYSWWITRFQLRDFRKTLMEYTYSLAKGYYQECYNSSEFCAIDQEEYDVRFKSVCIELGHHVLTYFLLLREWSSNYCSNDSLATAISVAQYGRHSCLPHSMGMDSFIIEQLVQFKNELKDKSMWKDAKEDTIPQKKEICLQELFRPRDDVLLESYKPKCLKLEDGYNAHIHISSFLNILHGSGDHKNCRCKEFVNNLACSGDPAAMENGLKSNKLTVKKIIESRTNIMTSTLYDEEEFWEDLKPTEFYCEMFNYYFLRCYPHFAPEFLGEKEAETCFMSEIAEPLITLIQRIIETIHSSPGRISVIFSACVNRGMDLNNNVRKYKVNHNYMVSIVRGLTEMGWIWIAKWWVLKQLVNPKIKLVDMVVNDYKLMHYLCEKLSKELFRYSEETHYYDCDTFKSADFKDSFMFCQHDHNIKRNQKAHDDKLDFWDELLKDHFQETEERNSEVKEPESPPPQPIYSKGKGKGNVKSQPNPSLFKFVKDEREEEESFKLEYEALKNSSRRNSKLYAPNSKTTLLQTVLEDSGFKKK